MSLKIRRGLDSERLTITPAEGELIYTTDLKELWIGDGTTVGGVLVGSGTTTSDFVFGEVPSGTLNGINPTFTSAYNFVPETVEVYLNGIRQKIVDDYNTSGNTIITFLIAPSSTEKILINYIKL